MYIVLDEPSATFVKMITTKYIHNCMHKQL